MLTEHLLKQQLKPTVCARFEELNKLSHAAIQVELREDCMSPQGPKRADDLMDLAMIARLTSRVHGTASSQYQRALDEWKEMLVSRLN
jgi:hypothetical protein